MVSSKSYWHLSRSKATQVGMTNKWLKAQGLVSIRDLWMKAQGYEVPSGYARRKSCAP
jgi:RNA-directed DNA polymerase